MRASDKAVRVAVVEDQTLFRSLLDHIITTTEGVELAVSCGTMTQARTLITPGSVDVALLDVDLPDGNGIALGVMLCRADPAIKVVLLSAQDAIGLMLDLPRGIAGTWSYLSKTSTNDSGALVHAIKVAATGGSTLDPALLRRMHPRVGTKVASTPSCGCSPRACPTPGSPASWRSPRSQSRTTSTPSMPPSVSTRAPSATPGSPRPCGSSRRPGRCRRRARRIPRPSQQGDHSATDGHREDDRYPGVRDDHHRDRS